MARPRPKPNPEELKFTYKGKSYCCENLEKASFEISHLRKQELHDFTENEKNQMALIRVIRASLDSGREGITAKDIAVLINCSPRAIGPSSRTWKNILSSHGYRSTGGVLSKRLYLGINRWYAGPKAEQAIKTLSKNLNT